MKVYNWSKSVDFVNMVPISLLRDFLFYKYPEISKKCMGQNIHQATIYDPTKLKGPTKTNPKATMCYCWENRIDLEKGMEWMLKSWVWAMEHEKPSDADIPKILEEIGSLDEDNLDSLWCEPVKNGEELVRLREPDWPSLWAKKGWTYESPPAKKCKRPDLQKALS